MRWVATAAGLELSAHCLRLVANTNVYGNTIYIQRTLGGLTPTIFEHVNALDTYTFNTDRVAGHLRLLHSTRAA